MRPYFYDYAAHMIRFYLARERDIDPVPLEELEPESRQTIQAVERAYSEFDDEKKYICDECYSPTVLPEMFKIQLESCGKNLGMSRQCVYMVLREILYTVAFYRGLIAKPYEKYKHLKRPVRPAERTEKHD